MWVRVMGDLSDALAQEALEQLGDDGSYWGPCNSHPSKDEWHEAFQVVVSKHEVDERAHADMLAEALRRTRELHDIKHGDGCCCAGCAALAAHDARRKG